MESDKFFTASFSRMRESIFFFNKMDARRRGHDACLLFGTAPISMGRFLSIGFALILLCWTTAAHAHAFLDQAEPAVGSMADHAPAAIRLHFSERLEAIFSGIDVTGPSGPVAVKITVDAADGKILVATPLAPLAAGEYQVTWHVVSVDTHKTEGHYIFTIKP